MADAAHDLWVGIDIAAQELVRAQQRRVHLEMDLDAQWLRNPWEQTHTLLFHVLHLFLQGMLGVALDPKHELLGDLVLAKELPQRGDLFGVLAPEDVQLRHGGRQVTDERRAHNKRHDEATNVVQTLGEVDGRNLVRTASELRESPQQGHGVDVAKRYVVKVVHLHPVPVPVRVHGNAIPTASKHMRYCDDGNYVLADAEHQLDPVRVDSLAKHLNDLLQAQQPQQANQPQCADPAEAAHAPREAGIATAVARGQKLHPVDSVDHDVEDKP
mmetsp:Transcript_70479/g.157821  ORF Transcript_70479/g.157821 Transcript_70479/m.157821 type:complete len:271 (-) Transcript_70479:454-1266(-)